jgi:hypothetical protein
MQALVVVVPHIATELLEELRDGRKRPSVDHVRLERVKERLYQGQGA